MPSIFELVRDKAEIQKKVHSGGRRYITNFFKFAVDPVKQDVFQVPAGSSGEPRFTAFT